MKTVVASILLVASVATCVAGSAGAHGRTLSERERWSTFGGEAGKCLSGMGRCYAGGPAADGCPAETQEECETMVAAWSLIDGTCEVDNQSREDSECTENGDQVRCIVTQDCKWAVYALGDPRCEKAGAKKYVGNVRGPQLGVAANCVN